MGCKTLIALIALIVLPRLEVAGGQVDLGRRVGRRHRPHPATYELKGVTTGQIGTDTTSLQSGSSFVIDELGTVTSMVTQSGVLTVVNGGGVDVLEGNRLEQRQLIDAPINDPKLNAPRGLRVFGEVSVNGAEDTCVEILGGTLEVKKKGLKITDRVPGTISDGLKMTTGTLSIQCGSTLQATWQVTMTGGTLTTATGDGANPPITATIDAQFGVYGGLVKLTPDNLNEYRILDVTQGVRLIDGKFDAGVKATDDTFRDRIDTDDGFTAHPDFKIKITEKEGQAVAGRKWDVLVADEIFYGINQYPTPDAPLLYTGAPTADDKNFRMTKK
jgi:hypothetical protein